ncbi:MAG: hypothetical protein K8T25_08495 [Planctomycetia bacterium]|nr:hypothetical protein [Planctomycetia bacterium]
MIQLDRSIPFVFAVLDGTVDEAAAILQEAQERHGLRWLVVPGNVPEDNRSEWYQTHLWPFLSETQMVLSAGDLQATGCLLLDTAGVDHFPTWRHWGQVMAEWANQFWVPRPSGLGKTKWYRAQRPWEYLDFYDHAYLSGVVAEYDAWRSAIWRVLSLTGGGTIPVVPGTGTDGGNT